MTFLWTIMQAESGENLSTIISLKEAERVAGAGTFWWGVGNRLNRELVRTEAEKFGGRMPVLFSMMLSPPKSQDVNASRISVWREATDTLGRSVEIPPHVLEFSRGATGKRHHFALVCHSAAPLSLGNHGAFEPHRFRQFSGKSPGARQVTMVLRGNPDMPGEPEKELTGKKRGVYQFGFMASLVSPWFVMLGNPRTITSPIAELWKQEWARAVDRIKQGE